MFLLADSSKVCHHHNPGPSIYLSQRLKQPRSKKLAVEAMSIQGWLTAKANAELKVFILAMESEVG